MVTKASLVCASVLSARGIVLLVELALMFSCAKCAKSACDFEVRMTGESPKLTVNLDIAI